MASALIAMSRSPEPEDPAREPSEKGSPTKSSEGDKDKEDFNTLSPDAGKKRLKIAIKAGSRRKSALGGVEVPNQEVVAEKKEESAGTVTPKDEKVNTGKASSAKQGEEAQAKQPAVTEQKPDSRKNYPKRENRKPPAHLAEALGPALFSTPDIIRRVSTSGENKAVPHSPVDSKEETGAVKPEPSSQDVVLSSTSDKVNEANELQSPDSKKKVDDTTIKNEVSQEKSEKVDGKANLSVVQPDEVKSEVKSEQPLTESSPVNSHRPETGGAVRPNRKRNIQIRLDGLLKKDPSLKHQSQGKDKKSRNVKTKGRGRRRSEDVKVEESDEEDYDQSSDDESWNSEDDPDRLWCICKKPHNNRFMICCDSCEDWFHGKCVGITKAMGKQMENKGLEWTCPNCSEKKQAEEKVKDVKRKVLKEKEVKKHIREAVKDKEETSDSHSRGSSESKRDVPEEQATQASRSSLNEAGMFCIVCKKAARSSSIYCSDECILKHAKESLSEKGVQSANKLNQTVAVKTTEPNSSQLPKARLDARVMVFERKTGKLLSGVNAPTVSNLKSWLKDNPTFEVVRPGDANAGKMLTSKQSVISKYMEPREDGAAAAAPGQAKLGPSQQAKKSVLVQQKISQLLPKPTQAKLTANAQANESPQSKSSAPVKPPVSPQKGVVSQKGVAVVGKLALPAGATPKSTPAKGLKQTILIPAESVHKIGSKAAAATAKSPGGNSKAAPKSPVLSSPSKSQQVPAKTTPPPVVSKVPATSTVKDPEKVVVRKIELKRTSTEPSKLKEKDEEKEKEKEKPPGPEPIRLNVRKTLQELLQLRIQECDDLVVSEDDIQTIALHIEEEMHSYFRDTGIKYKSKYRSLVFNIKDPKNLTLFRKIADKSVTPYQLVRLSPEELASQELAQWRERETKHQIEWIKKNELDMLSLTKTYVMKTHKGEQVIEAEDSLKAEVPDLVVAEAEVRNLSNNSVTSTVEDGKLASKKDKGKSKEKGKGKKDEKERSHEKDKSKSAEKKSKEKARKDDEESGKREHRHHRSESEHERHRSSRRDRHGSHDHDKRRESSHRDKREDKEKRDGDVEESDEVKGEAESSTDVRDEGGAQAEDTEPTSTVSIKTPDIDAEETDASVWRGLVNMPDVAKFATSVQVVSGDPQNLGKDLPEAVDIVGRIMPSTVWEYISKMKKTGTKEILVIRLTAANDDEKIPYVTLYTYLNSRNRLGVVGNCSKMIKDFYIMPLPSYEQVPQVLLPLRGPGFEDYRPHLLLGIIVRSKRKRLAPENEYVAKVACKRSNTTAAEASSEERSYTPPLPGTSADSYTPPLSPTQSFYSVSQHHSARRKWIERRRDSDASSGAAVVVVKHNKTSTSFSDDEDDADAPYSPGGSDDDDDANVVGDSSSQDNLMATPNNPTDLERKMDELNRMIEEQKQQIQNMSNNIVKTDATVTSASIQMKSVMQSYMLETVRKPEDPDESEAYSPSRSFTPPPSTTATTPSVLTSITSNISIPSNLQEILASIKKQETGGAPKGINLKADPIVQNYGSAQPEVESVVVSESHYSSSSSAAVAVVVRKSDAQTQLQSASSALLSLSTPVIHQVSDSHKTSRDPRQRGSSTPEAAVTPGKAAGSTLSTLSDDDLIKKAAEMMEMEKMDKAKLFHAPESGLVHPSLQPLPPGVEEDYSTPYHGHGQYQEAPSPSKHVLPPPGAVKYPAPHHGGVVTYHHHYKPPPPPPPSTPPPPPPPPPPPSAYNLSHGSSYQGQYGGDGRKMLPRKKRKYDEGPGGSGSGVKRDGSRGKSPPPGREIWGQGDKVPQHIRGRYGMRGRGYVRGNRGYMRQRGGRSSEHGGQMRGWDGPDKHFNRRKSPRYDAGIRSEWDMHIKDFEEKHRERSRQLRHGRDHRRDRSSSSSQRSSRRNRDSSSP